MPKPIGLNSQIFSLVLLRVVNLTFKMGNLFCIQMIVELWLGWIRCKGFMDETCFEAYIYVSLAEKLPAEPTQKHRLSSEL